MEAFEIGSLSFSYPGEAEKALCDVCFSVHQGELMTVCGPSGGGKSTLLSQLKSTLTPHGEKNGEILFFGTPLERTDLREQSARIGYVCQSPENQIVTDKVWHELAFGLESLGYDTPAIRGRVAEMASFFGIQTWFYKNVSELSGGQKQLLNLASVMAMQPDVLILDEPTSQLDPIAASDFLAAVAKLNRELGTTVIMTEHRLEEAFPMSDRVLVLDAGRVAALGTPCEVGQTLRSMGHGMFLAMPTAMRVWAALESGGPCPITVRDGRQWLKQMQSERTPAPLPPETARVLDTDVAVAADDLWFRYEKDLPDVVKGLSLTVRRGEFLAVLGGNGTGKTTALSVIGGLRRAYRGSVTVNGRIGMLPQNPQTLFVKKSMREDLYEALEGKKLAKPERDEKISRVISLCRLGGLLDRHPYDLSGGEQQRAALAKVLALEPEVLLMDEPTKGFDAEFKQLFARIIESICRSGKTVIMVSHDVEFCAEYADSCALFFDGSIVSEGTPRSFFSGNSFYTTSANRMARGILPEAVTARDVIVSFGGKAETSEDVEPDESRETICAKAKGKRQTKLPPWRAALAIISAAAAVWAFLRAISITDLSKILTSDGVTAMSKGEIACCAVLLTSLFMLSLAVSKRDKRPQLPARRPKGARKLPKRTVAAAGVILLLIPLTFFVGIYCFGGKKYYFTALLILLETMLPFFLVFEGRRPQTKELVVIAVLCTMGVAGRAAFFMLPNFKPVLAMVIISGVALGGEAGFLVGAMTMLCSNVLFGQGPWTPWQMFAMGIIGFLAGILFRKGLLSRRRSSLCCFGAISAIVLYGGIMNPASALMWAHALNWKMLLTYYITGFPMDLVHAFSTALILWFAGEPMLEKLDRVKVKYGLLD